MTKEPYIEYITKIVAIVGWVSR